MPDNKPSELDDAKQLLYHLYNTGRVDGKDVDNSIDEVEYTWQQLSKLVSEIIGEDEVFHRNWTIRRVMEIKNKEKAAARQRAVEKGFLL